MTRFLFRSVVPTEMNTPRVAAVLIASVTIITSVIVLPLYFCVVRLFLKKTRFTKHSAYFIMANVGIIDCLFLLATVQASVMTLAENDFIPLLREACSAIHGAYEWVLHFLALVLAINRLFIILNIKFNSMEALFKILTISVWISVLVILFFFHKYRMGLVYNYNDSAFTLEVDSYIHSVEADLVYRVYFISDLSAVVISFVCYIIVIAAVLIQKCQFRSDIKIESHEIRIFTQGLVTFLPGAIYWSLTMIAQFKFSTASMGVNILFSILPRLVPVLNLLGYLALNTYVRESILALVLKVLRRKRSSVRTISLGSGKPTSASRRSSAT
ncbi:hypothetical protein QR680_009989 [Steinernema hermaphroditum]|uniref:G-protein coupled receptors family 1 profile domain-containing protein n=1 Tax=Steinernema hermaphroditum TaxID=289476 RepID=A0AA39IPV4_9BILA|nr:hypothetical protein QR680_009989 [Steinernema hermaphroditum]